MLRIHVITEAGKDEHIAVFTDEVEGKEADRKAVQVYVDLSDVDVEDLKRVTLRTTSCIAGVDAKEIGIVLNEPYFHLPKK